MTERIEHFSQEEARRLQFEVTRLQREAIEARRNLADILADQVGSSMPDLIDTVRDELARLRGRRSYPLMERVLNVQLSKDNQTPATIREYLIALLDMLWREGEDMSTKRPFGNSGWEYEIYSALVAEDLIEGSLDEYGHVEDFDRRAADRLIADAIKYLGEPR